MTAYLNVGASPLGHLGQLFQGLPHRFSTAEALEKAEGPPFHLLNIGDVAELTVRAPEGEPVALPRDAPPQYALREGDVLITIRTRPVRAAVVPGDPPPMMPTQNLAVLRPDPGRLHGPYLAAYLNTAEAQAELERQYEQSAATPLLSLGKLRELPIPVPPLDTQRRVAELALGFEDEERAALAALGERRALVQGAIRHAIHFQTDPSPTEPTRTP